MLHNILKIGLFSVAILFLIRFWKIFGSYLQFRRWRDTGIVFMGCNTFNPIRDIQKIDKIVKDHPTAGVAWLKMFQDDFGCQKLPPIVAFNLLGRNYAVFTSVE
jgi:hypothetical protein